MILVGRYYGELEVLYANSCIVYIKMPRLSSYSNFDYPDGEEQIMPWEFWTDE